MALETWEEWAHSQILGGTLTLPPALENRFWPSSPHGPQLHPHPVASFLPPPSSYSLHLQWPLKFHCRELAPRWNRVWRCSLWELVVSWELWDHGGTELRADLVGRGSVIKRILFLPPHPSFFTGHPEMDYFTPLFCLDLLTHHRLKLTWQSDREPEPLKP